MKLVDHVFLRAPNISGAPKRGAGEDSSLQPLEISEALPSSKGQGIGKGPTSNSMESQGTEATPKALRARRTRQISSLHVLLSRRIKVGWLALQQGMVQHQRDGEQPPRGEDATSSQGGPSPRGRAQPDEDGKGLRPGIRDQAGLGAESPVRAGGHLAREEGEGGSHQSVEADALHGAPRALEDPAPSTGGRPEPSRPHGGERIGHLGGRGSRTQVGVPEVELHPGETGDHLRRRAHAAVAGRGDADSVGGHDSGTQSNALVQFHATRKLTESLEGDSITFLMGVGLRDPMASQAWGMMTNLCGLRRFLQKNSPLSRRARAKDEADEGRIVAQAGCSAWPSIG